MSPDALQHNQATNGRLKAVRICGEGIAATVSALLLRRAGFDLSIEGSSRPKLPAIMLGPVAQKLLEDVFEREDLFRDILQIRKRIVSWGGAASPVSVPHSAVVVPEQILLDRIQHQRSADKPVGEPEPDRDWTIYTTRPLPSPASEHRFGTRTASATPVDLLPESEKESCWIESLESGWLFLLPVSFRDAWLLAVGDTSEALLAQSRLVANQIGARGESRGAFPCYPRIADPLCGQGWFACGTAAIGFDPLCGDGAANATREAILAAASIRAVIAGAEADSVLANYRTRLQGGFQKHLQLCREFYASGHSGPLWDGELNAMNRGLTWCEEQRRDWTAPQYRLLGFALEAIR